MTGPGAALHRAAKPFGFAAAAVLVFMMLYTSWAVFSREVLNHSVLGVVDVMELSLVVCIFVALPGVFLRDENVTVDVIDHFTGPRTHRFLRFVGLVLASAFLIVVLTQMVEPARDKWTSGEATMTLGWSRFIHWIPIFFGIGFSILASLWVTVHYARRGMAPPTAAELGERDSHSGA